MKMLPLFSFMLMLIITGVHSEPRLEILPKPPISREVGSGLAVTCKPNVDDISLITQLEWKDPKGRRIETTNKASSVYVQSLPDEPGARLIFNKLTESLAGEYNCTAMYANTEPLQKSVNINTYVDIEFTDAPLAQYPVSGKDFKIKCEVQSHPSPTVDWSRDGRSIITGDRYVVHTDGLLIKSVRESDDGVYKCNAVVLDTGHIKSRDIKIEVQVAPKIEDLKNVSIVEGESASTYCKASGKPPPTYTWIKERTLEDLSRTDRFQVNKNTGQLQVTRVEAYDDSVYKCIAENPAGRAEATVKVNVLIKPKIYELINVTAPIQSETRIICKIQGRPLPKVSFRKTSSKVPFITGRQPSDERILFESFTFPDKDETHGVLTISYLKRSDDGLYECMGENSAGQGYKNGHITVQFPPSFEKMKNFPPVFTWDNRPGNLSCYPEAIPNATIVWKFNGVEIIDGPNFKIEGRGPISHLIVWPYNNKGFFKNYECEASNNLGKATKNIQLRLATRPTSIPQVRTESITATTVKFNIQPPANFDELPLRAYVVQYKMDRELNWDNAFNHTWSAKGPFILEGLVPERTYHFRFAAKNDIGLGPFQNTATLSMPRRSEPAEPKILIGDTTKKQTDEITAFSPYSDHFEFSWNIPNDNGDPIYQYVVKYCKSERVTGSWSDAECSDEVVLSPKLNSYEMNGLSSDTVYKIELWAQNSIGPSTKAQIRIKTARGADQIVNVEKPRISSAMIVGIVVASIVVVIVLVDIMCFCINRTGILAMVCDKAKCKKHEDEDPKLSREGELEPLKKENYPVANGNEKHLSAEYDGRHVHSRTGEIIGKNSAV